MNNSPEKDVALFAEALHLPPAERPDYLDRACAGDDDLRRRVEELLKAFDNAGDFLAEPADGVPTESSPAAGVMEKAGDRIGRYKLLQQIGEGGCGIVFMAEQEEPIRRRVALKIVKPGMDTKNVIARFEAERQALAMMDHPNIAQVFDAGATLGGRPYFVMELVRGIKITEYCDQNALNTRARLNLFIQVCGAIQHAHQKGIIHRDIKPSNVLVTTAADGKALPKVIDFGIAKTTLGQRLTDKTLFTAFEMLIGTPAYMSPEQAALTSVDVDTRSDIYSLGVLLYELLTSTTPFDTSELLKAGLDEVRRVIRDQEPVRPSTRLSTLIATDMTTVSRHHGAEVPKLIRDIRGDLDWIVMKAMEKDRTRRYPTANGLAMDIERYIRGEVVLACPPNLLYKARKIIGRNKLLFFSVTIIFSLLVAGLAITSRWLMFERQTRERMQHEGEVFQLEGLGVAQLVHQQLPEAETSFRQALNIRRQFLDNKPPNAMVVATFVLVLKKEGKDDAADAFLSEFLKPNLSSEYSELFAEQISYAAMRGQWQEATTRASGILKYDPDRSSRYHELAPLFVATQKVTEYRQLCQQIILRFKNTKDIFVADQMAKDCLILPDSGADLDIVGNLADFAVTHGKNTSSHAFFECCKALAEYRQGHFTEAAKWAELAVKDPSPYSQAEAYAVLAMARFKSDLADGSHLALTDCENIIQKKISQPGNDKPDANWRDWIIAHVLLKEAQSLLNDDNAPDGSAALK